MPHYQHPGVYVQDMPSVRSIQGASTSVAAFVGYTEAGPVDTPVLVSSWNAFRQQFGNPSWYAFTAWAVYEFFAEGGTACYVVRTVDGAAGAAGVTLDGVNLGGLNFAARSPGTWAHALMLMVTNTAGDPGIVPQPPAKPQFTMRVVVDGAIIDGPASPDLASRLLVAFVRHNTLDTIMSGSKTYHVLETFGGETEATLNDGSFAGRVNADSIFMRVVPPSATSPTGLSRPANTTVPVSFMGGVDARYDFSAAVSLLDKVQGISLLALPDTVLITDPSGHADLARQTAVIDQIMRRCEAMPKTFYVVDPPLGLSVEDIQGFTGGSLPGTTALTSGYAAIYHPWIFISSPVSGLTVPMPPSGPVLGRYAYTDTSVGVFKSPAGVIEGALQTVVAIEAAITDADQDQLNPHGINALRTLTNYGSVIWGARTLSRDPSRTYVSVQRLMLYVEQSVSDSLQWVVFEPSDQRLWASVTRDVSMFLQELWMQGGLFGAQAADAFFVTCDASNNPPDTQAEGVINLDIGLAPVYPAEFVVIRITMKTAASSDGA